MPYAIATQGVILGILLCIIFTISTASGSILLLDLAHKYSNISEFKDIGKVIIGPYGEYFGSIIQLTNLFLYFPVAMDVVASAAQGVVDPNFTYCTDYFVLVVSVLCLLTTQIRQYKNATSLAFVCFVCVIIYAFLIIAITSTYENDGKTDAKLVGNPDDKNMVGKVKALLGITTAVWSYIPSFIMIELLEEVPAKQDMFKAIALSAGLNMVFYITVGTIVVYNWGWDINDPINVVSAWPSDSNISRLFNALLFVANIISYALDSGIYCVSVLLLFLMLIALSSVDSQIPALYTSGAGYQRLVALHVLAVPAHLH